MGGMARATSTIRGSTRRREAAATARGALRLPSMKPKGSHAKARNTICLWYDRDAEAAARFYASVFPDNAVHPAPAGYPSGRKGCVLTVEFTVAGLPCLGLNGASAFRQSEAFSFQFTTEDQAETDRDRDVILGRAARRARAAGARTAGGRTGAAEGRRPLAGPRINRPRRRAAGRRRGGRSPSRRRSARGRCG